MTARGRGRPFLVNVRALRARPGQRQSLEATGDIDDLSVTSAGVPEGAKVRFDGWVESAIGGVTVAGTVTAPWSGVCRRCGEPARGVLVAEVREFFREEAHLALAASQGRSGLEVEDDGSYVVGVDVLDIEPLVHDACILELPLAPLCGDSCSGLCPRCGANRNYDACSCEQAAPGRDDPDDRRE